MGQRIRVFDWSSSSLGEPDQWPPSLKTTLSILLQSTFPLFLFWGPDQLFFGNDAYLTSLGSDEQHSMDVGQPSQQRWPESWPPIQPLIDQVLAGEEATWPPNQYLPIQRNGQRQDSYWTFSISTVRDEAGQVMGVLVIGQDTTPANTTRLVQEETQQQVLAFFEQSPVAIAIISEENLTFRMANPFYGYLVGRQPEQIVGKSLLDALPELKGQGFDGLLREVIATGTPYIANEVSVQIQRNYQLETIYVDLTYQPRREANQQVSGILVVATDVTQQVLVRKKIEASEEVLRNMVLEAPIGICVMSAPDLVSEIVNASFIEVAGKPYQDIIGKNYWVPFAEAAPYYAQALDRVVSEGKPFFANEVELMLIRHGKEEIIYVTFVYSPLKDADGRVIKVAVWVLENTQQVTERRKIEEIVTERTRELNAVNQQLAESNEMLTRSNQNLEQFASVASHDLQEPLRKIQSFSDLLQTQYADTLGPGLSYLERMQAAASRMSMLIKDLLAFSRFSSLAAATTRVSLGQVVTTALTDLDLLIQETGATITVGPLPIIQGDASQLGQLFQNLLGNALKFRRSGVTPLISIQASVVPVNALPAGVTPARRTEHYHRIDVADNGIGFEPKYSSRIFQVFQRLHGRKEFAGSGIGLAICQKVVDNHGGAITASSEPGKGATFRIYLPV
ncbi:PAS domain-containing sensor histidine kinase [Larkinella terrae]|nr:PAS domain-containing protein [Larkinella terrae]